MSNTIRIVIISAGLAAIVNCIFQLAYKILESRSENKLYKREQKEAYENKKKEAYLAAIDGLLQIKSGFDYTSRELQLNKNARNEFSGMNDQNLQVAPLIRLYATDEIFNMYYSLAQYAKYAYSDICRLIDNTKDYYNAWMSVLSRRMQEDLGYQKYCETNEKVKCPNCGAEHDIYSTCPKCGMTYNELMDKMKDIIKQIQKLEYEKKMKEYRADDYFG